MLTELIGIDAPERWDEVVDEFPDMDVYDLAGFHRACSVIGEGEPWLAIARDRGGRAAIPMLLRPVPGWPGICDASSAYGYPGVLLAGNSASRRACLRAAFRAIQDEWSPVTIVIRQNPFHDETPALRSVGQVIQVGRTVAVDLRRPEPEIWSTTRSLHRRRYRQAERLGPRFIFDAECAGLGRFHELYGETMNRLDADSRYHFTPTYLRALASGLGSHVRLFHTSLDGKVEGSALVLDSGRVAHYHLGGWSTLGLRLGLSRWLLERIRRWAGDAGREWFHLGGGVGAADDTLLWFKRGFSGTEFGFSIATLVLDEEKYAEMTTGLDVSSRFFPAYRSPGS